MWQIWTQKYKLSLWVLELLSLGVIGSDMRWITCIRTNFTYIQVINIMVSSTLWGLINFWIVSSSLVTEISFWKINLRKHLQNLTWPYEYTNKSLRPWSFNVISIFRIQPFWRYYFLEISVVCNSDIFGVLIWQMLLQLTCGYTCQIWMWRL